MEREEYSEELRHEHAEEGNFNKQVLSQEDYNRMSEFGALIAQDVSVIVKPYCLDDPPDELGTPGSMEIPLLTKCKNCGKDLFGGTGFRVS
jgi:hypothetical protein